MVTKNNIATGQQYTSVDGQMFIDQIRRWKNSDLLRQEDQLSKQLENVFKYPSENFAGMSLSIDTLSQQDITDGIKTIEAASNEHKALKTTQEKIMAPCCSL